VFRGIVSVEEIVGVFVAMRARCVRVARHIVGDLWSEDVTHDVFCTLLARRDELKQVPTRAYVLMATRHRAYCWKRPLVRARALSVDPADLPNMEALMYALEHGRPRTAMVTYADAEPQPEPDAIAT